jgi:hypothetical protein
MATTIIAIAAVTVAPAYAQQVDVQTKQAAEASSAKWIEAVSKGDAKTAVSPFTPDGISIDVYGKIFRQQNGRNCAESARDGCQSARTAWPAPTIGPPKLPKATGCAVGEGRAGLENCRPRPDAANAA